MAGKTILILGGGVGGMTAANRLAHRLRGDHRVRLVEREEEHLFTPSLLWLMTGARRPQQVTKSLRRLLHPQVDLVQAAVEGIDLERRAVRTTTGELGYDHLVIALGAELAPEDLPGYREAAHNFFSLSGASRVQGALSGFQAGRVVVAVTALPYKCPAAPYEAALLLEAELRRRGLRSRTEVAVFTPEPQPMPVAGPVMGRAVVALLEGRRIAFHPNRPLGSIDPESRELVLSDGSREPFDLLLAVPPHRPSPALKDLAIANEAGWIPVDPATLSTRAPDVHALGDATLVTLPNGRPLPKAGVFAHAQALVVADNLASRLGAGQQRGFDGAGYCWLETGDGKAAFASGAFYDAPEPDIRLRAPGALWHVGKVLFERYWLGDGLGRAVARLGLWAGSRLAGVPGEL